MDSAVAALAATAGAGSYVHLDIHLHHTVVTSLEVSDTVQRTAVQVVNEVGLLEIQDSCVNHVADLFIRQSRFDPLHHAVTEQALCNRMAQCLRELAQGAETQVDIEFEQARYQAGWAGSNWWAALQPLYDKLSAAVESDRVALLHPRLASLPAVVEQLTRVTPQVDTLDARAVYAGCMDYVQQQRKAGAAIYFVTQLAATAQPAIGVTAPAVLAQQASPTHILAGVEAYPLGAMPLYLSAQGAPAQSDSHNPLCSVALNDATATLFPASHGAVYVNGRAAASNTDLRPGDTISFAHCDREFALIRVLT